MVVNSCNFPLLRISIACKIVIMVYNNEGDDERHHSWDINYFRFGKTNVRHIAILLPVSISTILPYSACQSASGSQISSKSDHPWQSYDVISIFKMAAATAQFYSQFRIGRCRSLQNVSLYKQTKFRRDISVHGFDITTSVWRNKRPPYWDFSCGIGFDHIAVIGMLFCIRLPNCIQIGPFSAELWCYDIDFQDGGRYGTIYFRFLIGWRPSLQNVILYQRTKFRRDTQSTSEI